MATKELVRLRSIKSQIEDKKSFYAYYQLGPFSLGHSATVANSLRRSLLTELAGVAISEVEIQGVTHEYSALRGVRESVLEILVNLKNIVLTSSHKLRKPALGYLRVQGPGVVRANLLVLPSYVQAVDPEQYIATLSYDGSLNIKFFVSSGAGNSINTPFTVQQQHLFVQKRGPKQRANRGSKGEIVEKNNLKIPLDTSFVPVKKVNFRIDVEERLEKPKEFIFLEIWTNGSIHPRQALHDAVKALLILFYPLQQVTHLDKIAYASRRRFKYPFLNSVSKSKIQSSDKRQRGLKRKEETRQSDLKKKRQLVVTKLFKTVV
uniref:Plastid-encoded RNA polymerase subunit alpha n=1 Tax=Xylochloris irregularis TaxID=480381 RepID=A0A097KMC9_9CHLO|nr:alpha subunit of RNA polymerase [Xylochloris irregularis]AIT94339.1 alpha subunit of RNA polymerase [Xylochloris irregularis]